MARKKVEIKLTKAYMGMKKGHEVRVDVATAMQMVSSNKATFVNEEDETVIADKAKGVKKYATSASNKDKSKKAVRSKAAKKQQELDDKAKAEALAKVVKNKGQVAGKAVETEEAEEADAETTEEATEDAETTEETTEDTTEDTTDKED